MIIIIIIIIIITSLENMLILFEEKQFTLPYFNTAQTTQTTHFNLLLQVI